MEAATSVIAILHEGILRKYGVTLMLFTPCPNTEGPEPCDNFICSSSREDGSAASNQACEKCGQKPDPRDQARERFGLLRGGCPACKSTDLTLGLRARAVSTGTWRRQSRCRRLMLYIGITATLTFLAIWTFYSPTATDGENGLHNGTNPPCHGDNMYTHDGLCYSCNDCREGQTCWINDGPRAGCRDCQAGTYDHDGNPLTECIDCPDGYKSEFGAGNCEEPEPDNLQAFSERLGVIGTILTSFGCGLDVILKEWLVALMARCQCCRK